MTVKFHMSVYGFTAEISRSDGWYVGVIRDLHVVDQGKTLKALENRLKEGAELMLEDVFKNPKKGTRYLPKTVLLKLGMKSYAAARN